MARKAREASSTGKYAVILRGINEVFAGENMRTAFRTAAADYLGDGLLALRFYDNRVEMLAAESEKGISMDMKPLVTSFARTYNRETGNTGKVFADRFKSVPIETDELERECMNYLNGAASPASPFKSGAAAAAVVKKAAAERAKQVEPQEKEKKPDKPRKKNSLPPWLL